MDLIKRTNDKKQKNHYERLTANGRQIDICFRQHGRDYQEDSYLVKEFPDGLLVAVADGMGGHPHGDLASQEAIEILDFLTSKKTAQEIDEQFLRTIALAINTKLSGYKDNRGTTLIAAVLVDRKLTYIHIGDSYLKLIGSLGYITKPQEMPGWGWLLNCLGAGYIPEDTETKTIEIDNQYTNLIIYSDGCEDFDIKELSSCLPFTKDNLKELDELSTDNQTAIVVRL